MRQQGITMVELMVATMLLGSFFAVFTSLGAQVRREHGLATGYVEDIEQCRRALESLEGDLRRARAVDTEDGIRIEHPEGTIEYRLEDHVLRRTVGERTELVARGIDLLKVVPDGRLVRLTVSLAPRAESPSRQASVHTTVFLRNGGSR